LEKQAVSPPTLTSEADAGSDLSLSSISGDDEPATGTPGCTAPVQHLACILEGVFTFFVTILLSVIYYFNSRIMQTRLPSQRVCAQHWLCVTVYKLYIFFLSLFFFLAFVLLSILYCFVL
jgi:hypothetical protein